MINDTLYRTQAAYLLAKANYAAVQAVQAVQAADEAAFCKERGLLDPDGKPATRLWQLEDEFEAERLDSEFYALHPEHEAAYDEAHDTLEKAKNDLIAFAIALIPKHNKQERDTLSKAAAENFTIRKKLIDLALRLDVTTIPKKAGRASKSF